MKSRAVNVRLFLYDLLFKKRVTMQLLKFFTKFGLFFFKEMPKPLT